jgi:hypothetical protein
MGHTTWIRKLSFGVVSLSLAAIGCGGSTTSAPTGPGSPDPGNPGPPGFVGTYNISMAKVSETCSDPILNTGPWTLTLQGTASSLTITITALGTQNTRSYTGSIQADGTFSASAAYNLISGKRWAPYHDSKGSVQGRVSGNNVTGTESVTFAAPCDGATAVLAFSGSK